MNLLFITMISPKKKYKGSKTSYFALTIALMADLKQVDISFHRKIQPPPTRGVCICQDAKTDITSL